MKMKQTVRKFKCFRARDYKGDRDGIPHIHPIP